MPNSRNGTHLGFAAAVLQDVGDYYPDYRLGLIRDESRLKSIAHEQGDRIFLIDLPALGKVLDRALELGVLTKSGLPLSRGINSGTAVPRLFQGLWLRIFERNGCLKQDVDTQALFFLRTLLYGQKKFVKECSEEVLYATVKEFFDVDESLPSPSHLWDTDDLAVCAPVRTSISDRYSDRVYTGLDVSSRRGDNPRIHQLLDTVQKVSDCIAAGLGEYLPSLSAFKHGPGATAEFQRGRGFKYLFPTWSPRLESIFPHEEFALANATILGGEYGDLDNSTKLTEEASRLIAVPKTQKAPRLIAAEPTANQWCQQSIRDYLDGAIRSGPLGRSIDFRRQSLSQDGARLGSMSLNLATLDLTSASDRLSCWLVESLFRRNHSLLRAMSATRTRFITNSLDKKSPKLHKLRKFSSMGSALTFPVQSIVFLMLCVGVGSHLTATRPQDYEKLLRQVRVYGDDIIVPVSWVTTVIELFSMLDLKINESKSFWNGKFRESCGLDVYGGDDVTPAYFLQFPCETKIGSVYSTVEVSNNLLMKGLFRTASWAAELVPEKWRKLIPLVPIGSGAFGFKSFSGFRTTGRIRWNKDLQKYQYQTLGLSAKKNDTRHEGYANLLQYFTEEPPTSANMFVGNNGCLLRQSAGFAPRPVLSDWASGRYGVATQTIKKMWVDLIDYEDPRMILQTASAKAGVNHFG